MLKHGVFSCFWRLRVLKPAYFSVFLEPRGCVGALWDPRGAQRAILEHFRVNFGVDLGSILVYLVDEFSESVFVLIFSAI